MKRGLFLASVASAFVVAAIAFASSSVSQMASHNKAAERVKAIAQETGMAAPTGTPAGAPAAQEEKAAPEAPLSGRFAGYPGALLNLSPVPSEHLRVKASASCSCDGVRIFDIECGSASQTFGVDAAGGFVVPGMDVELSDKAPMCRGKKRFTQQLSVMLPNGKFVTFHDTGEDVPEQTPSLVLVYAQPAEQTLTLPNGAPADAFIATDPRISKNAVLATWTLEQLPPGMSARLIATSAPQGGTRSDGDWLQLLSAGGKIAEEDRWFLSPFGQLTSRRLRLTEKIYADKGGALLATRTTEGDGATIFSRVPAAVALDAK
ncbi:MAG: hypothetical protein HY078_09195 [Elusimicrobia bacterium]|nr:hypothetical protein [Elusimicrobiota bacterium]